MAGDVTPKQAMFVAEFLVDGNGKRAAIAAGVPEKSASVTASRWLKNPKIAAIIAQRQAQRAAKLDITADRVLQELMKLATFDPGKLYDEAGNRIPVHLLDDWTRAAVAGVEDETQERQGEADSEGKRLTIVTRRQKVRMAEKGANLERLGKHLKLFGDASFGATVEAPGGLPADSTIKIVLVRPA